MHRSHPRRGLARAALAATLVLLAAPGSASAGRATAAGDARTAAIGPLTDTFNGRIAFGSQRVDPPAGVARSDDIFTIDPDGTDLRRLTTSPQADRQPDWSPSGTDIAYSIRKPGSTINYEVARMSASGRAYEQLTSSPAGVASSQPSWYPHGDEILYRRSGPGLQSSIWTMGSLLGNGERLLSQPSHPPLYPSWSPDMTRILFAAIVSPKGDTDRGIFTVDAQGSDEKTIFDTPGTFDSGPAWSPDGTRIAFESNANVGGGNPEGDLEIWTMAADGTDVRQLTHNALHDEGAAWSPDGRFIAYSSGVDNAHEDIEVMTADGVHVRRLTSYPGLDESPDWQAIPAPVTARRCGDLATRGPGAHDVRARGRGMACPAARALARRWIKAGHPRRVGGFRVAVDFFGGTQRIVLTRAKQLVAFLYEPADTKKEG